MENGYKGQRNRPFQLIDFLDYNVFKESHTRQMFAVYIELSKKIHFGIVLNFKETHINCLFRDMVSGLFYNNSIIWLGILNCIYKCHTKFLSRNSTRPKCINFEPFLVVVATVSHTELSYSSVHIHIASLK